MRRRTLLRSIGGAALVAACGPTVASPSPTRPKPALVGALILAAPPEAGARHQFVDAISTRLGELGWKEGENLTINARFGLAPDPLAAGAAELVAQKPDVLFCQSTTAVLAARDAAKNAGIPVVFGFAGDPLVGGAVEELARPRGNVTGFGWQISDGSTKGFELLRELLPGAKTMGVLASLGSPVGSNAARVLTDVASRAGVAMRALDIKARADVTAAYQKAKADGLDALVDVASPLSNPSAEVPVGDLVRSTRLPTAHYVRASVEAGGLLSYGPNGLKSVRDAAGYIDKILRGAKVADLPVQLETTFDLVISLKAAAVIGLTIPDSVLARAQDVIR